MIFCFFQTADRFSNKDNELQWTVCVSLYVRETGRLKDPGGTSCNGLYGDSCGEPPPERGTFFVTNGVSPNKNLLSTPSGKRSLKRQVMSALINQLFH